MITIGTHEVTTIYYGSHVPTIYIDNFQTWPSEPITYVLSNVAVVYSSGSGIFASGSNFATIQATVTTKRGNTTISVQNNVELNVSRSSAPSNIWTIDDGKYISAVNRGTVQGSSRSGTFIGEFNGVTTGVQTVMQYSNNSHIQSSFDSITVVDDEGDSIDIVNVSHNGGTIGNIYLQLNYLDTSVYDSGAEEPAGSSSEFDPDDPATPDTYTIPTGVNWLSLDQYGNLSADRNTSTSSSRESTITVHYTEGDVTADASVLIHQWDASVRYYYTYSITGCGISPTDEFESYEDNGTFYEVWMNGVRRYGRYEDGGYHVTQTTRWNSNDSSVYVEITGGDTEHFELWNVDEDTYEGESAVFDWSDYEGRVLITPYETNDTGENIEATLTVHFFDASTNLIITHLGD